MSAKKTAWVAGLTAGLLALSSGSAQTIYNPNLTNRDLAGEWKVTGPQAALGDSVKPATFTFGVDGKLSGTAGCNTVSGRYAARGPGLIVQPLALTRQACEPAIMQAEQNVVKRLQGAYRISLEGDNLHLEGQAGELFLRRSAPALNLSPAAPTGETAVNETQPAAPAPLPEAAFPPAGSYRPALSVGGKAFDLPSEAQFDLAEESSQLRLSGTLGCNRLSALGSLAASGWTFGGLQSTRMLCPPELDGAEAALAQLLAGPVTLEQTESGALELSGSNVTLRLAPKAAALPAGQYRAVAAQLGGQALPTEEIAVQIVPTEGTAPRLSLKAGCNILSAPLTAEGSNWALGPALSTLMGCETSTAELETALAGLLDGATLSEVPGGLLLSSEAGELRLEPAGETEAAPVTNADALEGKYQLEQVVRVSAKQTEPLDIAGYIQPVTLRLTPSEEGGLELGGSDGCNAFGGHAALSGNVLQAQDTVGTLRYCDSLSALPNLPRQLLDGAETRLSGDTLTLTGSEEGSTYVWTFTRG